MKTLRETKYGDLTGKVYKGTIDVSFINIDKLKHSPKIVDGNFYCTSCKKLETLEGAPEVVKGEFECFYCNKFKNLKGAPKVVGDFRCSACENLETLEGAPEIVEGEFKCEDCPKLKNLDPLLKCDIEEVVADKHLLDDYIRKKNAIKLHGYDKAMEIFEMMNYLS